MKIEILEENLRGSLNLDHAVTETVDNIVNKLNVIKENENITIKVGNIIKLEGDTLYVADESTLVLLDSETGVKSLSRIVKKIIIPEYNLLTTDEDSINEIDYKLIDRFDTHQKLSSHRFPFNIYKILKERRPELVDDVNKLLRIDTEQETFYMDTWIAWFKDYDFTKKEYYDNIIQKSIAKMLID